MDNFTISTPSDLEKIIFPKEDESTVSKEHVFTLHLTSDRGTGVFALDKRTTMVRCVTPEGEVQVPLGEFIGQLKQELMFGTVRPTLDGVSREELRSTVAQIKHELLEDIARETRRHGAIRGV